MTSHSDSMSPGRQKKLDPPVEEADELPTASQVRFDNPVQARNRLAWTHNIVEQAKRAFLPRRPSPEGTRTVTAAVESSNEQAGAPKADVEAPPIPSSTPVAQAPQTHWGFGGFAPPTKPEETSRVDQPEGGLQSEDVVNDSAAAGADEDVGRTHIEEKGQGQEQALTAPNLIDEALVTPLITEDVAVALPALPDDAVMAKSASQSKEQQGFEPETSAQTDSIASGSQQQLHEGRIEAALQDRHQSELASEEAPKEPVVCNFEQPFQEPTEIDQEVPQDPDETSLQDVIMIDGPSAGPSEPSAPIAAAALAEQESEDELEDESGQSSIDAAPAAAVVAATSPQTGGEQLDNRIDVAPPVVIAANAIDLWDASPSPSPAAAAGEEEQDQLDDRQDPMASQQQMSLQANPGGSWSATEDEASMEPAKPHDQVDSQVSAQAANLPVRAEALQSQSQASSSPPRTSPPRPEDIDSLPFSVASETQPQRLSESLAPVPVMVAEEAIAIASQSLPADEVEASSAPSEPLVKNPIRSKKVVVIDSESSGPSEVRPTPATSQPLADKVAPEVIVIDSQSQQASQPQQPREDVTERVGPEIVVIDSQSQQPTGADQLAAASSSRNTSSTSCKQVEASLSAIPWPTPAQRPVIPPMSEDELEIRAVERSRLMSLRAQRRNCVQVIIEGRPRRAAKDQHHQKLRADAGPSTSKSRLLPHDDEEESQAIVPAGMRKSGTQPSTSTLRIDAQQKDKNGQTRLQFTKVSGGGERQTTTQSSARKSRFIVADESTDSDSERGSFLEPGPSRPRRQPSEEPQEEDDPPLRPREARLEAMDVDSDSSMDQVPRAPTMEERQERQRKRHLLSGSSKSEASQIMTDAEEVRNDNSVWTLNPEDINGFFVVAYVLQAPTERLIIDVVHADTDYKASVAIDDVSDLKSNSTLPQFADDIAAELGEEDNDNDIGGEVLISPDRRAKKKHHPSQRKNKVHHNSGYLRLGDVPIVGRIDDDDYRGQDVLSFRTFDDAFSTAYPSDVLTNPKTKKDFKLKPGKYRILIRAHRWSRDGFNPGDDLESNYDSYLSHVWTYDPNASHGKKEETKEGEDAASKRTLFAKRGKADLGRNGEL